MTTGIPFPAFCQNIKCGSLFFTSQLVAAGPETTVTMIGSSAGPCPKCGGVGLVPNGDYTISGAALHRPDDVKRIQEALQLVAHQVRSGASVEDVKESISKNYPELSFLKKYLPQNATELIAYLTLLGGVLAYCSHKSSDDKPNQVHVTVEVQQVLEQALADPKTNQPNSQQAPLSTEEQKTEEE